MKNSRLMYDDYNYYNKNCVQIAQTGDNSVSPKKITSNN